MRHEEQNDANYRQSLQDIYARQEIQFTLKESLMPSFLYSDYFKRFIQFMTANDISS